MIEVKIINSESDPTCRYFLPIFASKTWNKNNMRLSSAFLCLPKLNFLSKKKVMKEILSFKDSILREES